MPDDIVTRLRDYNCRCTFVFAGVVGIVCEACEAADEIERLRALIVEFGEAYNPKWDDVEDWDEFHAADDRREAAWSALLKEARRG